MTAPRWRLLVTPAEACHTLDSLLQANGRNTADQALLSELELKLTQGRVRDATQLVTLLKDCDAAVLDLEAVTQDVLARCPKTRVLSRFGEGCDAIDLAAAQRSAVRVTRTRGVTADAVARHTLALTLGLLNRVAENDRNLKQGHWQRLPNQAPTQLRVGLIGYGNIGSRVARLLEGLGFTLCVLRQSDQPSGYDQVSSIKALVQRCDILSLHAPANTHTAGLINAQVLQACRGKYLINTARGALVDECAVLDALNQGTLAGYATDVFAQEPIAGTSKQLAMHKQTLCSPHIAALDPLTARQMTLRAVHNAVYALDQQHAQVNDYVV